MTPSMGMAAPKGMAPAPAPQAGLAALGQPNTMPRGKSSDNMGQVMALARKMSDAQLADVLQGKSLNVPQYVAMTEAMGRKSLRTAMEGAQAQQALRQPSLKEKLLAEQEQAQMAQLPQAGLDQLPAPTMAPQGMAGGGIVAFDGGGTAYDPNEVSMPAPSGVDKRIWEAIKEKFGEWNQPWGKTVDASPAEIRGALAGKNPKQDMGAPHPSDAPAPTAEQTAAFMGDLTPSTGGVKFDPTAGGTYRGAPTVAPKKSGLEALMSGKGTAPSEAPQNQAAQDYLAKLEGLTAKQREGLASIRSQGGGEALMQLASGLLSSPTLAGGLAKGMPLVAATSAASRKEQAELNKAANEYDLHLAKAREAVESGDKDRAFQEKKLAAETKARMAALSQGTDLMRNLAMLQDPKMMALYQEMNAAKKPTDVVSRKDAMEEFNKYPALKRQYGDFDTYYKSVNNNLLSATIPGQGAQIRPYQ